jgi:hypothetical protein
MSGVEVKNVVNKVLTLGNNLFEGGSLLIPAMTKYTAGTLLTRGDGGEFKIADAGGAAIAVLPFDTENKTDTEKATGIRALISGSVRLDMVHYDAESETELTAAQRDALRDYGIIPVKVYNTSQPDNQ